MFIFLLLFLAQLNSHLIEERKIDIYFQGFPPPHFSPLFPFFPQSKGGMGWGGDGGVAQLKLNDKCLLKWQHNYSSNTITLRLKV